MLTKRDAKCLLWIVACVLADPAHAAAREDQQLAPRDDASIIVVAQGGATSASTKTDAALTEIPRNVSIVTSEEITLRGVDTVMQALQYSAGFNGQLNGRARERGYSYVRGFLAYQFLDGLKLYDRNWAIEPFGLDRVELLRGPGSTLYGQASPGGIVALASKLPIDAAQGQVFVDAGSFDRVEGGIDVGGPIDSQGTLLVRLVGLARSAGTEQLNTSDDRIYVAPAVTAKLGSDTKITLLGSYQLAPNLAFINYALPTVGSVTPSAYGYIPRSTFVGDPTYDHNRKTQRMAGYLFEHRFGNAVVLHQSARYTNIDTDFRYFTSIVPLADQRTVTRRVANVDENTKLAQIDTNLTVRFDTAGLQHEVLIGVDWARLRYFQASGTGAAPSLDLYAPVYDRVVVTPALATRRDQRQTQTGAYVQDQMTLGRLHLVAGGRHDWVTNSVFTTTLSSGVVTVPVVSKDRVFTGQVGAILNLASGFSPYANYSTSFYPVSGTDFFGQPFRATRGHGGEIGAKFKPGDANVLLTADVFRIVQQNVTTRDPAHPTFNIQTGEVRSKGVELEAKATLAHVVDIIGSYTHLDAKVTQSNTGTAGFRVPATPADQAALWLDARFGPAKETTFGFGVTYFGPSFGDGTNTFSVRPYTLLDGNLGYDLSSLGSVLSGASIQLTATNLLDRRYVSSCDAANDCFYGLSRVLKATIRKRF